WRRNEILHLTWTDVDLAGGVIRLTARRSKTKAGRVLPISAPLRQVLDRRTQARRAGDPRVFFAGRRPNTNTMSRGHVTGEGEIWLWTMCSSSPSGATWCPTADIGPP